MNDPTRGTTRPVRLFRTAWFLAGFWTVVLGATLSWELRDEFSQAKQLSQSGWRDASGKPPDAWASYRGEIRRRIGIYSTMWLVGLAGIALTSRMACRHGEDLRRTEEALQESRTHARDTAAHIPGVVYQYQRFPDGSHTFPYVSEGITRIIGITPEDVQRDPTAFFPGMLYEDDPEPIFASIEESAKNLSTWQHEIRLKTPRGKIIWIRATSIPHAMPDGSVLFNGAFLDITDLKQTESQLQEARDTFQQRVVQRTAELEESNRRLEKEVADRAQAERWMLESEERFRGYFELGLVGMAVMSKEKDWIEVNHRLCKMLGYTEDELMHTAWDELTHPDDREAEQTQLNQVLSGAAKGFTLDKRFVRKDDRIVHVNLSLRCLRRPDGKIDSLVVLIQDITDRKQAEESLKQSRAFLQTVIDAMPNVIMVIDRNYRICLANEAARQACDGADPVSSCLTCYKVNHRRDAPCKGLREPCPLAQVIATKLPQAVRHTHFDAQGREVVMDITAAPIFDEQGEVVQVVESCRDVTARHQAEEALEASERNYREIFNAANDMIVVHDMATGQIIDVNSKAVEVFGFTSDEAQSLTLDFLCTDQPPYTREDAVRWIRKTAREGPQLFEWQCKKQDGQPFWVEVNLKRATVAGVERVLAVVREITDRKQAEEHFWQEKNLSEATLNSLPGVFYCFDEQGKFLRWNQNFETISGYSAGEILQMHPLDFIAEEDRELVHERIMEVFSEGQSSVEAQFLSRSGQKTLYYFSGARHTINNKTCLLGMGIDITERQRAEDAARCAQDHLLQLQEEETARVEAELSKVRDRLIGETRLATLGQVSAGIAPGLRNPLSVIRNTVYLLKRQIPRESQQQHACLESIDREVIAADRIIGELLATSLTEEPRKEPTSLESIITEARSRLHDLPEAIQWDVDCRPNPFSVHVDKAQMEQVLQNLFANAIDAMVSGGAIRVEASRLPEHDQIIVSDGGPGIPEELRRKVFEPLFTDKDQGAGMGLSICRQIIERHGGTIEARDGNPGAALCIRLPRETNSR